MKIPLFILIILCITFSCESSSLLLGPRNRQKRHNSGLNPYPFSVCRNTPTDLVVSSLNISPDPPIKGASILVQLNGTIDEQLTKGSNFDINVLFMGIKIYSEKIDMAQATTLPVNSGPITFRYSVLIPSDAPSGPYIVQLIFNDQTNTEIGCISVYFNL